MFVTCGNRSRRRVAQMARSEIFPMKGRSWRDSAVIEMALFGPGLFEFIPSCPQSPFSLDELPLCVALCPK